MHEVSHSTNSVGGGETPDVATLFTREYWDERYGAAEQMWSGNPNRVLVEQASGLEPGHALDVGCGEGGDAIWLASRGWRVTALDVSAVALERGARHAAAISPEVAARITWEQADIRSWDPAPRQFDLVSSHFMHLPPTDRDALLQRLAAAVRPGGTLLFVGHHISDLDTTVHRYHLPDLYFSAAEVAATLDPQDWEIRVAASLPRQAIDPGGESTTIRDAVMCAVRRS